MQQRQAINAAAVLAAQAAAQAQATTNAACTSGPIGSTAPLPQTLINNASHSSNADQRVENGTVANGDISSHGGETSAKHANGRKSTTLLHQQSNASSPNKSSSTIKTSPFSSVVAPGNISAPANSASCYGMYLSTL